MLCQDILLVRVVCVGVCCDLFREAPEKSCPVEFQSMNIGELKSFTNQNHRFKFWEASPKS